jgi:hypothetical protein
MKKLVFGLIATVMIGFVGNAQKIDLKPFETKNQTKVKTDDATFQSFLKQNQSFLKEFTYSDVITVNQLNDKNLSVYDLQLLKNEKFNHLYVVSNASDKTFQTFLVKSDNNLIVIYNNLGEDLYTISNVKDNAEFVVTLAGKRSCFGKCMDDAEATMTDDFVGWVAWNLSPGVQIAVAIHCVAKCR